MDEWINTFLIHFVHKNATKDRVHVDDPSAVVGDHWSSMSIRVVAQRRVAYVIQYQLSTATRMIACLEGRGALNNGKAN